MKAMPGIEKIRSLDYFQVSLLISILDISDEIDISISIGDLRTRFFKAVPDLPQYLFIPDLIALHLKEFIEIDSLFSESKTFLRTPPKFLYIFDHEGKWRSISMPKDHQRLHITRNGQLAAAFHSGKSEAMKEKPNTEENRVLQWLRFSEKKCK